MKFTKSERNMYFNADGSVKRMLKIAEILPDGIRVFENGCKASPSAAKQTKPLNSLSPEERRAWEEELMCEVGRKMSEFCSAQATGAFRY